MLDFYRNHFNFIEKKEVYKLHSISTSASKLTFCYPNGTHRNSIKSIKTYPGQKIQIYMTSLDAVNRNVYTTVAVNFAKNNVLHHFNEEQVIHEDMNCTSIELVINSNESNTTEGKLIFSLPSFPDALVVNVILQPCP